MRLVIACVLALAPALARTAALAEWSAPTPLFKTAETIDQPTFAVAPTGELYVAWSVSAGHDPQLQHIYLARREGTTWSEPQTVVTGPTATAPNLAIDPYGDLHLLWYGALGRLQYDLLASDASKRGFGAVLATSYDHAAISADARGRVHLVYGAIGGGPTYRTSTDGGESWAPAVAIASPSMPKSIVDSPRLALADDGGLHAVWSEYGGRHSTSPIGVFYARSADGGVTWSPAAPLAGDGATQINVAAVGDRTVHVVWNGSGESEGRYHRWSPDGGLSWSPPAQILAGGGTDAVPQLVVDSAGVLHLVTDYEGDIWHTAWDGASWHEPECISCGDVERAGRATRPAAVIAHGNDLEVVYWQGLHELRQTSTILSAPELPPSPVQIAGWWSDRFWHRDLPHVPAFVGILASIALVRIARQRRHRTARAAS